MNNHIDLFSGIGGFALAAYWCGYKTEVFCEQDKFCQKVLQKHWPTVPIVSDIRYFDGTQHQGAELLTGGFPCQPFSCSGKRRGHQDDRYLWPEMLRVISEARPRWVVGENVAGIIGMALDGVLSDLEAEGYETQAFVIPACAVNAPHRRDRVWIVANARYLRGWRRPKSDEQRFATITNHCENLAYSKLAGLERCSIVASPHQSCDCSKWTNESSKISGDSWYELYGRIDQSRLGGMVDGLSGWMDGHFDAEPDIPRVATRVKNRANRLKALGNAIVPQISYQIIRSICSSNIQDEF